MISVISSVKTKLFLFSGKTHYSNCVIFFIVLWVFWATNYKIIKQLVFLFNFWWMLVRLNLIDKVWCMMRFVVNVRWVSLKWHVVVMNVIPFELKFLSLADYVIRLIVVTRKRRAEVGFKWEREKWRPNWQHWQKLKLHRQWSLTNEVLFG